eukprot:6191849-Pleurochrysis_carterae.AAC.1
MHDSPLWSIAIFICCPRLCRSRSSDTPSSRCRLRLLEIASSHQKLTKLLTKQLAYSVDRQLFAEIQASATWNRAHLSRT